MSVLSRISKQLHLVCLFFVILLALGLYIAGLPLPPGLHPDEIGKIFQIFQGESRYFHPLLLLHLGAFFRFVLGVSDTFYLLEVLRLVSLACSAFSLFACYLLSREVVSKWWSVGVVALLASTPIFAHHAQYVKEDILLLPWLLGSFLALFRWRRCQDVRWAVVCGIMVGLAMGSKYIGGLVLIPMILGFAKKRKSLGIMLLVSIAVFALIMLPSFVNLSTAWSGFSLEVRHARYGHWLQFYPWAFGFSRHLIHNLVPGAGLFVVLGGIGGSVWFLRKRGKSYWNWVLLIGFGAMWYLLHEFSPSKPFVGGIRYILPVVPFLILAFVGALQRVYRIDNMRLFPSQRKILVVGVLLLVVGHNLTRTIPSILDRSPDPRVVATLILAKLPPEIEIMSEQYSAVWLKENRPETSILSYRDPLPHDELLEKDIFVTSDYYKERFLYGLNLSNQHPLAIERGEFYLKLANMPVLHLRGKKMPMPSYRQLDVYIYPLSNRGMNLMSALEKSAIQYIPDASFQILDMPQQSK